MKYIYYLQSLTLSCIKIEHPWWIALKMYDPIWQSTSCEMLGWINHKLESRLPEEISITSDIAKSEDELNSLLMKVKEESEMFA